MAAATDPLDEDPALARRLARAVLRARLAGATEAVWREAIVPVWLAGLVVALAWLGLRDLLPGPFGAGLVWSLTALVVAAGVRAALRARAAVASAWRRETALGRIERASALGGRVLTALDDALADASAAPETRALWAAHRRRAAAAIGPLSAGAPHPDLARRDRYALRPALGLLLFVAWFAAGDAPIRRLEAAFAPGLAASPSDRVDVWIEPPPHTGQPPRSLMIDGVASGETEAVAIPIGSRLVVRASSGTRGARAGAVDATANPATSLVADAPAGATETSAETAERHFAVVGAGRASIAHDGRTILSFGLAPIPDRPPTIDFVDVPSSRGRSGLRLGYDVEDDWGVASATARIVPAETGGRPLYEPPSLPLTLPAGARHLGHAETVRDLSGHPFAGGHMAAEATVVDGAGQEGHGRTVTFTLPGRPFHDPLARALVDLRRRLALDAGAIDRIVIALDALTLAPERFGARAGRHLGLAHLAAVAGRARDDAELRDLVEALWVAALIQEAGDTIDEEQALEAAKRALAEALRAGASEEEIARLTQALRQAMDRYLEALTRTARADPRRERAEGRERRVDRQSLSRMLDRVEDLGRTGSREAAERLLAELGDTLDALRGARPGEAGEGEAQRRLGDMIRRQRDLQEQTHRAERDGADDGERERLTQAQKALRDDLRRLRDELGDGASGEGDGEAEGALGQADRSMDEAGRALDQDQGSAALDAQGRALDGLRRGAREMARGREGREGEEAGQGRPGDGGEDPLGRPRRSRKADGAKVGIPETFEVERARRILDDLRRRRGDPGRPSEERDYLDRLMRVD